MRSKVITVTQTDIDKGFPGNCKSCPVARAVRRAFKKGEGHVSVLEGCYNGRRALINVGRKEIPAPVSVIKFVKAFDGFDGIPVKPFTLEY